ncbi:quinolinate phosphoribosyltransferase (decarboxylating) [Gammaproteobacteria bacterium]
MIPTDLRETVIRALAEDVGRGDLTAALVGEGIEATATVISRESAVLCGCSWFNEVFRQLDPRIIVKWLADEGDNIVPQQTLCRLQGSARALLTGERSALNFLQTLSGTATISRRFAEAVAGTCTRVLDTRKTLPGLRNAQKYAVRVGGCYNHRHGLDDGILIKENHLFAMGSIAAAVTAARTLIPPGMKVEVEVENLEQVVAAIEAGADLLLLDNFNLDNLRQAVSLCRGRVLTESSGNVTLATIRTVAEIGVDFISTGAMTKDVRAVDLSMRFAPREY